MPLISIIIPIYNAELYLHKCLKSIVSQSFSDWELILVNDGSNDSSALICEQYKELDTRIIFVQQTNSGVSAARNHGMSMATGKYLMFIDADDWLENNSFSLIAEVLQSCDAEIIQFGYYCFDLNGIRISKSPRSYCKYNSLKEYSDNFNYATSVWGYLFLRRIVVEHNLLFNQSVRYAEDQEFTLKCFFYTHSVFTINKPLYNYNDVPTSVMHNAFTYSRAEDTLLVLDNLLNMYMSSSLDVRYMWNREIRLLFENYYRTVSKIPFTLQLLRRIVSDLDCLFERRKVEVDTIFNKRNCTNPFFVAILIFYFKLRVFLYQVKVKLKKVN